MKYIIEHKTWTENADTMEFMRFCQDQLGYAEEPNVQISDDKETAVRIKAMGYFDQLTNLIWVYRGPRVKADWYRTLAHELVHHAQRERGATLNGHTGSDTENEANAQAGAILRMWGSKDPAIFESSDGSKFFRRMQLAKVGLAEIEDIGSRIWIPAKRWQTPDGRRQIEKIGVSELLIPEDFENLDSLRSEGIIWYTDPTPGMNHDPDTFLRIVGPASAVKSVSPDIDRIFDEAFHRLSDYPKADGLSISGWYELIWHMTNPERNAHWGQEQPAVYARWKSEFGL